MLDDDRVPPKGGRAAAEAARADYLAAVRLRHVLHAIGASRHGEVTSHVKGDETRGVCVSSDGNAEHHVVAWSPEGILAIAYDDDASPLYLDRDCEDVQAVLADIPERLKPLIADVAKPRMGLPVTSAKWIEVTDEGPRQSFCHNRSEQLSEYEVGLEAAIPAWIDETGVAEPIAKIALELVQAPRDGRRVSPEQSSVLLDPSQWQGVAPPSDNVKKTVTLLRQVGIDWADAEAQAAGQSKRDGDHGYALIDAVLIGDHAGAEALLAKGANTKKRSRPDQDPFARSGGWTPLAIAAQRADLAMVELLLGAGADPGDGGTLFPPLHAGAQAGSRAVCERLIARGAVPQGLYEAAIKGKSPAVIELALELGMAKPLVPGWYNWLRAACLDGGRKELLERCPGYEEMEKRHQDMHAKDLLELRSQAKEILIYVVMREIALALRRLHFPTKETSVFEGTAAKGRYSFAPSDKERHVVAWNEQGVVLWAISPPPKGGVRRPIPLPQPPHLRGQPPPPPIGPFESAPEELRKLVQETASWEHAPKDKSNWRWVYPAGNDRESILGIGLTDLDSPVRGYGKFYDMHTIPGTDNWPREIYKLKHQLGEEIERIAKASLEGPYAVTPADDTEFRDEQPKSRGFRSKELPRAAEMLAALGIHWSV